MREAERAVGEEALVVGTAMADDVGHPPQQRGVRGAPAVAIVEDSGDAAHGQISRRMGIPSRRLCTAISDAQVTP